MSKMGKSLIRLRDYVGLKPPRSSSLSNSALECINMEGRGPLEDDVDILSQPVPCHSRNVKDSQGNLGKSGACEVDDRETLNTLYVTDHKAWNQTPSSTNLSFLHREEEVSSEAEWEMLATDNEKSLQEQFESVGVRFGHFRERSNHRELYFTIQAIDKLCMEVRQGTSILFKVSDLLHKNIEFNPTPSLDLIDMWKYFLVACIGSIQPEWYERRGMKSYLKLNLTKLKRLLKASHKKSNAIFKAVKKYEKEFKEIVHEMHQTKLFNRSILKSVRITNFSTPTARQVGVKPSASQSGSHSQHQRRLNSAGDLHHAQINSLELSLAHGLVIKQCNVYQGEQSAPFGQRSLYEKRNILQAIFEDLQDSNEAINSQLVKIWGVVSDIHCHNSAPGSTPFLRQLDHLRKCLHNLPKDKSNRRYCIRALILNKMLMLRDHIKQMVWMCKLTKDTLQAMYQEIRKVNKNIMKTMERGRYEIVPILTRVQSITVMLNSNVLSTKYGDHVIDLGLGITPSNTI